MMREPDEGRPLIRLGYTGAPALVQLGFMRAIDEAGFTPRVVATGLGALVGALWACETDLQRAAGVLAHLSWDQADTDLFGWVELLVRGRKIEELSRPLTIVALDLTSGERVAFREGPLADAVRKAAGLPGWLPPLADGRRRWVDAGHLTPSWLQETGILTDESLIGMIPAQAFDDRQAEPAAAAVRLANAWHSEMMSSGNCMLGADVVHPLGPLDFHAIEVPTIQVYRHAGVWLKHVACLKEK